LPTKGTKKQKEQKGDRQKIIENYISNQITSKDKA
jgi:hypothetical protein